MAGPRLLSFNAYANPDANEVTVVQLHPEAESMVHHMSVITEHVGRAYAEFLERESRWQIYGTPRRSPGSRSRDSPVSAKPLRPLAVDRRRRRGRVRRADREVRTRVVDPGRGLGGDEIGERAGAEPALELVSEPRRADQVDTAFPDGGSIAQLLQV